MGCGMVHFGRRGLETTQTDKILSPGVWTRGANETPLRRESKPLPRLNKRKKIVKYPFKRSKMLFFLKAGDINYDHSTSSYHHIKLSERSGVLWTPFLSVILTTTISMTTITSTKSQQPILTPARVTSAKFQKSIFSCRDQTGPQGYLGPVKKIRQSFLSAKTNFKICEFPSLINIFHFDIHPLVHFISFENPPALVSKNPIVLFARSSHITCH